MRGFLLGEMNDLSFPDFEVEKMEFSAQQKKLKILVSGAWLNRGGGEALGKGILYFNEWTDISINKFDSQFEQWVRVENVISDGVLKDLCETEFYTNIIYLRGFSTTDGCWLEWKIMGSKSHAEFQ